ncbi:MBL fold metallo-hydrolase [Permianibacter aggregans]|uniref:Glyoxylase-like metal-dependent hydrolase (Beta-lactamase superfamily II) n=1 Tax=Permianibacter aggregans TaxID=1510150 RepID=A0A4R6UNJ3_9GAMM|nr:MBL fold metallo-hydrolase [Permianibacter aggregans]QGX38380.1 MBL fold metallo-hydrolase [Permianibacter aggregans]TDQ48708.1 glyoxylase-like metal-dependent hydrolase (beta-lactamase superfamily II) [Permianibacter aggregans]
MWRIMFCCFCGLLSGAVAAGFTVHKLADGIYATERNEPPGLMFDANNVFIINEQDVVVVDSNISPDSSREVLAALRKLTNKPVRYVINTHWHEDHILGNSVWREAYPDVQFIGHVQTHQDLSTTGATNRKGLLENGAGGVASLRQAISSGKGLAGNPVTEEERRSHESDIFLVERYLNEAGSLPIIYPDLEVDSRLVLTDSKRPIEIRFLGAAHTRSDLIVWLPSEKLLIAGDLVVWPIPLIGSTSYPRAYAQSLREMLALQPEMIVPGHGPVFRDTEYSQKILALLDNLCAQVQAAKQKGETLEQAKESVDLSAFRQQFAGDSALLKLIFSMYVQGSGIPAAYNEPTAD